MTGPAFRALVLGGGFAVLSPAGAQSPAAPPTLPVNRGGYGTGASPAAPGAPSPTSTAPASAPADAPATRRYWYDAAVQAVQSVRDKVNTQGKAAAASWQTIAEGKVDQRVQQLLQQAGFSAADIQKYYPKKFDAFSIKTSYLGFYADNLGAVAQVDLFTAGNARDLLGVRPFPDGNRRVLEDLAAAATSDLQIFTFYDQEIQKLLPLWVETQARLAANRAEQRKEGNLIGQIENQFVSGAPYEDPTNVAVRQKLRAAQHQEDAYADEQGRLSGIFSSDCYLPTACGYVIFGRYLWIARHAGVPYFQRTDQLLTVAAAVQRLEAVRDQIAAQVTTATSGYLWPPGAFDDDLIGRVHQDFLYALNASVLSALRRPSVAEADVAAFEKEAQRLLAAEPAIAGYIQQSAAIANQSYAPQYAANDLNGQASDLKATEVPGDDAGNAVIEKEIGVLVGKADDDLNARNGLLRQLQAAENSLGSALQGLDHFQPLATNRVLGAWIDFQAETWPTKYSVPQEPLKGAPLRTVLHTAFGEVTVGVPGAMVVEWEPDPQNGSAATQSIAGLPGGASLTAHQQPNTWIYRSDPLIFLPPDAGGGTAPPATTSRTSPPEDISGTWNVSYEDLALGEIDGTAVVDQGGAHAAVTVRDPKSGQETTLQSTSITYADGIYTLCFAGASPSSSGLLPDQATAAQALEANKVDNINSFPATVNPLTGESFVAPYFNRPAVLPPSTALIPLPISPASAPLPAPLKITLPGGATSLALQVADYSGQIGVVLGPAVETNQITLKLHFVRTGSARDVQAGKPQVLLTGTWAFEADPVTRRDGAGQGRVGYFRRELAKLNTVTQSAAETWTQGVPRIQLFALGTLNYKRIDRLYTGVPTTLEVAFLDPQPDATCQVKVEAPGGTFVLIANRDPEDFRRFVTTPFVPGTDGRPAPPPTTRPLSPATDDSTHLQTP